MKARVAVILSILSLSAAPLPAAVNILVLGSTHSYSESDKPAPTSRKAFDASAVAESLRVILKADPQNGKAAKVAFEEVHRRKTIPTGVGGGGNLMNMEYRCYSLAQYYFWPDTRSARLANIRGRGKTRWSHVVIVGDPFIIANMPGVYAQGVNLIANVVKKGGAKPILLMACPQSKSPDATGHLAEITYRIAKGAATPVAPAGYAWSALADNAKPTDQPYLAAACVYSRLFARAAPAAENSRKILASHALKTVQAAKTRTHFTGRFEFKNPFAMKYVNKRSITYNHTGTSSERGIERALAAVMKRCSVSCRKAPAGGSGIDFNFGRANSMFEANKRYKVAPKRFGRSYGFPMQDNSKTAAETMLYGIDKRYVAGRNYDDGTDLGIAYDMIRQGEVASDIRAVPIRLMWAKLHDANRKLKPLRDKWHMSRSLDEAGATFMYTLLSGRRPAAVSTRLAGKIGYETAVILSHLQPPTRR